MNEPRRFVFMKNLFRLSVEDSLDFLLCVHRMILLQFVEILRPNYAAHYFHVWKYLSCLNHCSNRHNREYNQSFTPLSRRTDAVTCSLVSFSQFIRVHAENPSSKCIIKGNSKHKYRPPFSNTYLNIPYWISNQTKRKNLRKLSICCNTLCVYSNIIRG